MKNPMTGMLLQMMSIRNSKFNHFNKKESDKYARGLAGKAVENPEFSDLPDDARLNF